MKTVARFLIAVWPFPGHFFPLIAIAQALRERGHTAAFYTGAKARPIIAAEGFTCFPFERIDEKRVEAIMFSRSVYTSRRQPLQLQALLREWLLGTLPQQVTDLTSLLDAWPPDVLVSETSMLAPMLVLQETRRMPVAVFSTVVACLLPGPEAPPFGLGLPRPHNWRARLLARLARRASDLLGLGFRRAANQLRESYGLKPLSVSVTEFTGQMPLYLVPSVPEFDYGRRDLPPSVHYIGPCLWNKPSREPAPLWLAQLPHDRPVVHVTEGTMHTEKPLVLRTAAQALADLPVNVVMTTGGNREPAELGLGPLAPNIRVERWVAHSDLLPRTQLVVTTGGAGTVMAVLAAGVPLVIVPTDWDKPENAQRVVEAGAGLRLPLRHCQPERLRAAVERVLAEPAFRQNAERLAAVFRRVRGPQRAAELLEDLALGQIVNVRAAPSSVPIQ